MRDTRIQIEDRNGITLMEVLIAIGILAIGLSSVAALMPAAGSQAKKAVVADRAASMAENALADAITIGLTRPTALSGGGPRIVFDPVGDPGITGLTYRNTTDRGMFGGGTAFASAAVQKLFGQNRDDLVYDEPASEDALPINAFFDGTRGFLGRTSCVWTLESLDGNPVAAGNTARLSAVLFHERDQSSATASIFDATIDSSGIITWTGSLPDGKTSKQIFKPGTVVVRYAPLNNGAPAAYVLRAAPGSPTGGVYAIADDQRLTDFTGGTLPVVGTPNISILVGSVGLAQKVLTLEGNSEYTLSDQRKVTP
jgi:type II secretory pathway pseudopilin PulG